MKKLLSWSLLLAVLSVSHSLVGEELAFSVANSIQMVRFNDQPQTSDGQGQRSIVNVSPDRKYGVLLTSRGILQSNRIESTLWLIDLRAVKLSLQESNDEPIAPLRVLAVIAATPAIDSRGTGVYGAVISNVRWSSDSQTVLFLGENARAERQLYSVKRGGGPIRSLTPPGQDVESFDFVKGMVAYLASSAVARAGDSPPGVPINAAASVITDVPVQDAIFNSPSHQLRAYDLWCIRNGKRHLAYKRARVVQFANYSLAKPLVVSPDGRFAIMLCEAKDVPESWEQYETPPTFRVLRLSHKDLRPISRYSYTPLREYVMVDLRNGVSTQLGAVDARYFNYPGAGTAVWSPLGDRVLLTNVFLPLKGADSAESSRRSHPCLAAAFERSTRRIECLTFSTAGVRTDGVHLQSASFGAMGDQAILRYGTFGQLPRVSEVYRYSGSHWTLTDKSDQPSEPNGYLQGIRFSIREGLNERPTLWVEDEATTASRKMWDPNPQLEHIRIGQAAIYRWKDQHGNEWVGGLFKPVGYLSGKRYPLVIQTHGFDQGKFITDGAYPTAMAARPLASNGIMVLQIGGGGNISHISSPAESEDNVEAYESAIDSLTSDGLIDPKKVGIIGFSRTCWYVEQAIEKDPGRFAAATLADGVSYSYMQYILSGPGSVQLQHDYEKMMGGAPVGKGLENWLRLAPDFHADLIETPLRIETIEPVSVLQEWELYSSLKMQEKPVDLIYFPLGQHVLQAPLERFASQQGNVEWFRFWLQGYEDPDPEKTSQYERWRIMRDSMAAFSSSATETRQSSGTSAIRR